MTGSESNRIQELESRFKILEEENAILAEHKEDIFLLGQIAEIINSADNRETILEALLEKSSILKNIPFCAFGDINYPDIKIQKFYSSFADEKKLKPEIALSDEIIKELETSAWIWKQEFQVLAKYLSFKDNEFKPNSLIIIPVQSQAAKQGLFIFADDQRDSDEFETLLPTLTRICEMAADKLDNIYLTEKLKEANETLEQKVIEQTADLKKANIEFEQQIQEHEITETALRESEERYRYFVQQTAEGFFRVKTNVPIPQKMPFKKQLEMYLKQMYVAECNDIFARMYGYSDSGLLNGMKLAELHGGDGYTENAGGSISFIKNGYKLIDVETQEVDKHGNKVYFLNNAVGIIRHDCLIEIWGTQRNITKRKLAEEALRNSEKQFREVSDLTSDFSYCYRVREDGEIVVEWVTGALAALTGYQVDEIKKKGGSESITYPEDLPIPASQFKALLEGKSKIIEYRIVHKNGSIRWLRDYARPDMDDNGNKVVFIYGAAQDITERKEAEQAMQESEAKYRNLIQHSSDAIYLLYNRHFEVVNDKFLEMFKVDIEYVNSPEFNLMNLVAPQSYNILEERQARLDRGEKIEPKYEFTALTADGEEFQVEASITYINFKEGFAAQGIIRDITESKKLEEQFRQSQKMEAVGQLAGGIAHDFNNLLTIISGYSDLLINNQKLERDSIDKLHQIRKAGERAQSLTNQLLASSRQQIVQPEVLDVNNVLNNSMKMYARLIGEDIKTSLILGENLPSILADPHQIEQILMNLLVNARDAIHAKYQENFEKIITVETSLEYIDDEYAATHLGSKPGRKIMLSISDTGIGMSKDTIKRIFDPFYTTKVQGKGTGLGMSTVYGIVKQNDANIYVYSEPGKGSTFKIFWPLSETETEKNNLDSQKMKIVGGNEKILFVEDDEGVRDFGSNALLNIGYNVQSAASAEEAWGLITTKKIEIDIMITDLVMPGMSGRQLADKIQEIYKDLPVIFVSGYTDNHIVHHGVLDKDINFVQKPYSIAVLAAKIRELLSK